MDLGYGENKWFGKHTCNTSNALIVCINTTDVSHKTVYLEEINIFYGI